MQETVGELSYLYEDFHGLRDMTDFHTRLQE